MPSNVARLTTASAPLSDPQVGYRCPVLDANTTSPADWRLSLDLQTAADPRDALTRPALTDNPEQCWSPPLSRVGSAGHWQSGPWCFVDGAGADTVTPSSSTTLHDGDGVGACPGLRRETCGVTACAPPASSCVESRPAVANARVLLENGGFERSQPLGPNTAVMSRDLRAFDLDVVPLGWFFCAVAAGATGAAAADDAATRCAGYSDATTTAAATTTGLPWRVTNDTARTRDSSAGAIELRAGGPGAAKRTTARAHLGAVASLAAGATYELGVWYRCGSSGSATTSLDANLVATARVESLPAHAGFAYDTSTTSGNGVPLFEALPVASGSNSATATTTGACAGASADGAWRQLTATFVPSATVRDVTVALRVESPDVVAATAPGASSTYSGWVAFDDATLTRIAAAPDASTSCSADADWACNVATENFFNRLREQRGVPFGPAQFAYLIYGPLNAARTWVPFEVKGTTSIGGWNVPAPCDDMIGARVPGITEASVDAALANFTDAQLVEGLGWGADAATEGGFAAADVAGAVRSLREELWRAIDAGVLRPFSGPAVGVAGWQPAMSGPRVPRDPVGAVEHIVNVYLANEYRRADSTVCALDRDEWSSTLCYVHAWYLNSYSSQSAVMADIPVKFTGELFATVWHGKATTLATEQRDAVANWAWSAANVPPATFATMIGGGLAAIASPLMGNMTMLGLMPCPEHFMRAVHALSAMPYPCNTILGFDQPWVAQGYVNMMLEAHKEAAGGLCVNSLNLREGRAMAASVIALARAEKKSSLPTWVIPVVVASCAAVSIAVIAAVALRSRRSASDRDDRDALSKKLIAAGVYEFDDDGDGGGGEEESRPSRPKARPNDAISRSKVTFESVIATGGEGTVYLGTYKGVPVAVKSLKSLKHAEHEINIFRHLPRHENLVRLIGYTNIDSKWSLVMEYCNFHCLHQCMQTGDFFDVPGGVSGAKGKFMVKVLADTLEGVAAIHDADTYHNDIKMENVMVSCARHAIGCDCLRAGRVDDLRVKISDLGMSKTGAYAAYSSGNLRGTICYIPKERVDIPGAIRDIKRRTKRDLTPEQIYVLCDIYAFGLMAYELCESALRGATKRITYPGQVCAQSPLALLSGQRPDVSDTRGFGATLRKALEGCWAHDPWNRTATARDAARDFAEAAPAILDLAERAPSGAATRSTSTSDGSGSADARVATSGMNTGISSEAATRYPSMGDSPSGMSTAEIAVSIA